MISILALPALADDNGNRRHKGATKATDLPTTPTTAISPDPLPVSPPCTPVELLDTLSKGFDGFGARDLGRFGEARAALPSILGCQTEILSASVSARVLAFGGLSAGVDARDTDVGAYFRGAASTDPNFPVPDFAFVPGTFYDNTWKMAAEAPEPEALVLLDRDGESVDRRVDIYINGVRTRDVLPDRVSLVQVRIRPRDVIATFELQSSDSPRLPDIPELADALGEYERLHRKQARYLMVGGITAASAVVAEVFSHVLQVRAGADQLDVAAFRLHQGATSLGGLSAGVLAVGLTVAR